MTEDHLLEQIRLHLETELSKLKALGITDSAIVTYIRRLQEGQSKETATAGLLRGRSLTSDQIQYVRAVLDRLSLGAQGAGG